MALYNNNLILDYIDEEIQGKLIEKSKEIFGLTDNCDRAGYILPNGDMLNFGNPYDSEQEQRYSDHSEVWQIYEQLPEIEDKKLKCSVNNFINQYLLETGAMRINTFVGGEIDLEVFEPRIPTRKQLETLEYCTCIIRPDVLTLDMVSCKDEKSIYNNIEQYVGKDCVGAVNDLVKKYKAEVSATIDS